MKMAKEIAKTRGVVIKTAFTSMTKYNELYSKFGENLNQLLAASWEILNDALDLRLRNGACWINSVNSHWSKNMSKIGTLNYK